MKKLIIFALLTVIFTSCDTAIKNPILKESEKIAVLEKVKTDTLTTIIEMDDKYYIIKENKVDSYIKKQSYHLLIGYALGIIFCLVIIGIFID